MNTQTTLETYADRIDSLFEKHCIKARVTGGTVFPYAIHFSTGGFVLDAHQQIVPALQESLGLRVYIAGDSIIAERTISVIEFVTKIKDAIPPRTATLGVCDDGAPLLIRLPSQSVGDILITGPNRAANTSLLRSIAISLALTNTSADLGLLLVGESLADLFKQLPHCKRFAIAPYLVCIVDEPENVALREGADDRAARLIVATTRSVSSGDYGTVIRQAAIAGHFEAINSGQSCAFRAAQYL